MDLPAKRLSYLIAYLSRAEEEFSIDFFLTQML